MQLLKKYTLLVAAALVLSCASERKISRIRSHALSPGISLTEEQELPELSVGIPAPADTMVVEDPEGNKVLIMRAIKDENGEMVATDVIKAAVVTSRFRNVAERSGRVDLRFRITVPQAMQDSEWQLRFFPRLSMLGDTVALNPVFITGSAYRKAQLRGYQRYERFLATIVSDTTVFIDRFQLETFLKRNIPALYRFRTDSSYVSEEQFASAFGVTEKQAIDHYMDRIRLSLNRLRRERKDEMYRRYVRVPIVTEGLRLDTVIHAGGGDLIYDYVQTIHTRPKLRKAEITLAGGIFAEDRRIYEVPESEPLAFYISSIGGLVDDREHYLTHVLERKVELQTACYIDFKVNSAEILPRLGNNGEEIRRIRSNFVSIMENREFELDSVVVRASCSPEGSYARNRQLSVRRSDAVSDYFNRFMRHWTDSVTASCGFRLSVGDVDAEAGPTPVRFIAESDPENWTMLDALVQRDTVLSRADRERYMALEAIQDPDLREKDLQKLGGYRYMREHLYPRLRTVRFDFHLHRKGMQKDTVRSTVLDSTYMAGVQAIRDADYERAVSLLRPYKDYNCAVAYCAMDYNATALQILEGLERTDRVNYMLAILYSRRGDDRSAVECYIRSCAQNRNFVHRGNLDPEISVLIRRYNLHAKQEEI